MKDLCLFLKVKPSLYSPQLNRIVSFCIETKGAHWKAHISSTLIQYAVQDNALKVPRNAIEAILYSPDLFDPEYICWRKVYTEFTPSKFRLKWFTCYLVWLGKLKDSRPSITNSTRRWCFLGIQEIWFLLHLSTCLCLITTCTTLDKCAHPTHNI